MYRSKPLFIEMKRGNVDRIYRTFKVGKLLILASSSISHATFI